jgi:hypothetical protein
MRISSIFDSGRLPSDAAGIDWLTIALLLRQTSY